MTLGHGYHPVSEETKLRDELAMAREENRILASTLAESNREVVRVRNERDALATRLRALGPEASRDG